MGVLCQRKRHRPCSLLDLRGNGSCFLGCSCGAWDGQVAEWSWTSKSSYLQCVFFLFILATVHVSIYDTDPSCEKRCLTKRSSPRQQWDVHLSVHTKGMTNPQTSTPREGPNCLRPAMLLFRETAQDCGSREGDGSAGNAPSCRGVNRTRGPHEESSRCRGSVPRCSSPGSIRGRHVS